MKNQTGINYLLLILVCLLGINAPVNSMCYFNHLAAKIFTRDMTQELIDNIKEGNIGLVQQLIAANANIDAENSAGHTALGYAALYGPLEIVQLLLEAHANVNLASGIHKATPLQFAACSGKEEIVKLLLQNRAKIHAQDNDGNTALIVAAVNNQTQIVSLLLDAGAEMTAQNKFNENLLTISQANNNQDIIDIINKHNDLVNQANITHLSIIINARIGVIPQAPPEEKIIDLFIVRYLDVGSYFTTLIKLMHWQQLSHKQVMTFVRKAVAHDQQHQLNGLRLAIITIVACGLVTLQTLLENPEIAEKIRQLRVLPELISTVQTLYRLKHISQTENTLGIMPDELMNYLIESIFLSEMPFKNLWTL